VFTAVQEELITSLPEILSDDVANNEIATFLVTTLEIKPQLTTVILDCLTNLNLASEDLSTVHNSVLQSLNSAEVAALPVLVKFVLQLTDSQNADHVASALRNFIDLNYILRPPHCTYGLLTLDALKSGFQFQPLIGSSWITGLEKVECLELIDVYVLLHMLSLHHHKKRRLETFIKKLVRKKLLNAHVAEQLVEEPILSAFKTSMNSLIVQCSHMLASNEVALRDFASGAYRILFEKLGGEGRQWIVSNLVVHIGSKQPKEVATAVDILHAISEESLPLLRPFEPFIKAILDYIDEFSTTEVRKIFSVLCALGSESKETGLDDVHMVVRKRLSSAYLRHKRVGIVGAVVMIRYLDAPQEFNLLDTNLDLFTETGAPASPAAARRISVVLDMLTGIAHISSCSALICEEFALLLSHVSLSMEVVAEVRRRFTRDFEEAFLCSIDDVSTGMLFSDVPEKSFCRLFLIFFGYQSVGGRSICWPSPACIIWMATLH
jgi:Fanconi anemia group D2 protein